MPLFEFRCADCGTEFEKLLRKAGLTSDIMCPVCQSRRVEEQLSAFASPTRSGSATSTGGKCGPAGG